MYTKKDLIKLSAGKYTLPTQIGVWTIEKRTSNKWEAYYDEKLHATVDSKTLEKLIVEIELESDFISNNNISSLQYTIKINQQHIAQLEVNELTDELADEQYKSDELFYSYDSTVPVISDYNPISFSEAMTNAAFNLFSLFVSFANFVAKYQLIRIALVLVLAYLATYIAPISYNAVKVTTLTILPFAAVCAKISVISLPFIAIHYANTNKLLS